MGMNYQRTADMLDLADEVKATVGRMTCADCQDVCWWLEVWTFTSVGDGGKSCLIYRPHLSGSEAVTLLGRWAMGTAGVMRDREREAWVLEHQGALFD